MNNPAPHDRSARLGDGRRGLHAHRDRLGFVPLRRRWNGAARPTTFRSASQLTARSPRATSGSGDRGRHVLQWDARRWHVEHPDIHDHPPQPAPDDDRLSPASRRGRYTGFTLTVTASVRADFPRALEWHDRRQPSCRPCSSRHDRRWDIASVGPRPVTVFIRRRAAAPRTRRRQSEQSGAHRDGLEPVGAVGRRPGVHAHCDGHGFVPIPPLRWNGGDRRDLPVGLALTPRSIPATSRERAPRR